MTKLRDPISFEDALDRVIGNLRIATAAAEIGKRPNTLRAYSNPDDERQLGIKDALALDRVHKRLGLGTPIFDAYALQLEATDHAIGHCPAELARRLCRFVKENGDAVAAIVVATSPAAKPADLADALRELREALDAARDIVPLLEASTGPP